MQDTPTNLITKGFGFTNKFGIEVVDNIFTPVINGQELLQGEDGNLPNPGKTYLIIYLSRVHSATIQFDNLTVQEVK
jgi:hypothetical protein